MMRFRCIYCGRRLVVRGEAAGKKGKCPKCGHELVVPASTKGRPAVSWDKEEAPKPPKKYVPAWAKGHIDVDIRHDEVCTEFYKDSLSFIIPHFDELSLFLMAVVLNLIFLASGNMQSQIENFLTKLPEHLAEQVSSSSTSGPSSTAVRQMVMFAIFGVIAVFASFGKKKARPVAALIILALVAAAVLFAAVRVPTRFYRFLPSGVLAGLLVLSLVVLLVRGEKPAFVKWLMLVFGLVTTLVTGVVAGVYMLTYGLASGWLVAFPLWNIVSSALLVLVMPLGVVDLDCISSHRAGIGEVGLGMAAALVVFGLCHFVWGLHWSLTYSICIVYSTSFSQAVRGALGLDKGEAAGQPSGRVQGEVADSGD